MSNDHVPGLVSAFLFGLIFSYFYLEPWGVFIFGASPLVTTVIAYYSSGRRHVGLAVLYAVAYHGFCHSAAMVLARAVFYAGFTPSSYQGEKFLSDEVFRYNQFVLGIPALLIGVACWLVASRIDENLDEEPY